MFWLVEEWGDKQGSRPLLSENMSYRGMIMEMMMFTCPATGREISTGIHIEPDSFERLPATVTKAACPHCGAVHYWWTHEARLSDTTELTRFAHLNRIA
jgi:predicted RNA-binding Zn-ribbon protein involved in translation (DUF1610 family)